MDEFWYATHTPTLHLGEVVERGGDICSYGGDYVDGFVLLLLLLLLLVLLVQLIRPLPLA